MWYLVCDFLVVHLTVFFSCSAFFSVFILVTAHHLSMFWFCVNNNMAAATQNSVRFPFSVPADIRSYLLLGHRHHGYGCGCGEPVGFVIAAGVVADLVGGTVEEGDGAEPREA